MVMQHRSRILTVEEARNLPPPTPEEVERRREASEKLIARLDQQRCAFLARGGVPLSPDEFMAAIGRGWDDDEDDEWDDDPGLDRA